jgi:hypothetical protein
MAAPERGSGHRARFLDSADPDQRGYRGLLHDDGMHCRCLDDDRS